MVLRFLVVILMSAAPLSAHAYGGFHPPSNPMEKTVATAIMQINREHVWAGYLLHHMEADPAKDAINNQLFTQDLLEAWKTEEARRVYTQCGGHYIEGRDCGFTYNPLTCLTFIPPQGYSFRTDSSAMYSDGAYNGLVSMRIAGGEQLVATYVMKMVSKQWLIDGVECRVEGQEFNMD